MEQPVEGGPAAHRHHQGAAPPALAATWHLFPQALLLSVLMFWVWLFVVVVYVINCDCLLNRHLMKHCVNCHLFKDIWESHEQADVMLMYGN